MKKRALVVDDIALNRLLAIDMLQRQNWDADEAADGVDALAKLNSGHRYALVLLDIKMPGMSGDEVCKCLRADPKNADLPLVAYTAHALEEEKDSFLAIGFNAVLIKPIDMATLRDVLSSLNISA